MKKKITVETLKEVQIFCAEHSKFQRKELFGVTDRKAVGTLVDELRCNHEYRNKNKIK